MTKQSQAVALRAEQNEDAGAELDLSSTQNAVKVTKRVRIALEAMVWRGLGRREAAEAAGMVEKSLYHALRTPNVRQFLLRELEVLRTSAIPKSIHALEDVRDNSENAMARVQASRTLLANHDDGPLNRAAGVATSPGVTIQIVNAAPTTTSVGTLVGTEPDPFPIINNNNNLDQ